MKLINGAIRICFIAIAVWLLVRLGDQHAATRLRHIPRGFGAGLPFIVMALWVVHAITKTLDEIHQWYRRRQK